jgi:hypothetical protein
VGSPKGTPAGPRLARFAVGWMLVLGFAVSPSPARADQPPPLRILGVTQRGGNGDGNPDVTIIDGAFVTDHDQILVFDGDGDMSAGTDWRTVTDFMDDTWVYDIGADGSAQVIVRYQTSGGRSVASIYDDRDGDGRVAYRSSGTGVLIDESPYWTARITSAPGGWFLPDGHPNLNVRIDVDGPIPTLDRAPDYYLTDYMPHDGRPDVSFEEVADPDGVATYALRRLLAPSPYDWGFGRAWLWGNAGRYPTAPSSRAFFPFLQVPVDPQDPSQSRVRYFDRPPNVAVDWSKGSVTGVGLEGYPIGDGYHFNSNDYITPGAINDVSFESPQAYYDLAQRHDAFPTAHIRFFTRPPEDPTMFSLPNARNEPWQAVAYDWNVASPGSLRWDFKVSVAGNYTIDDIVHFPDFDVRTVPYDNLPYWITERDWKLTTFLAREGPGYQSSEGLYEWMADTGDDPVGNPARADEARAATLGYMQGAVDAPPDAYFQTTYPGFRAERHFATAQPPKLYFSPIDRKVHLFGAESGIWTIDDRLVIRSDAIGGGPYLNHWRSFEDGFQRRELYAGADTLLYTDASTVTLVRARVPPSLSEALPPRNHSDWLSFRDALFANERRFQPDDFPAMLSQFNGSRVEVKGATASDIREVAGGFRFVITLRPGFRVRGRDVLRLARLSSGSYVVAESRGSYSVLPLTPPAVGLGVAARSASVLEQTTVRVTLDNHGRQDLPGASLDVVAMSPAGQTTTIATRTVALASGLPIEPSVDWAPPSAGTWTLIASVRDPGGALVARASTRLSVASSPYATPTVVASLTTAPVDVLLLFALLVAFGAVVGTWLWSGWTDRSIDQG